MLNAVVCVLSYKPLKLPAKKKSKKFKGINTNTVIDSDEPKNYNGRIEGFGNKSFLSRVASTVSSGPEFAIHVTNLLNFISLSIIDAFDLLR